MWRCVVLDGNKGPSPSSEERRAERSATPPRRGIGRRKHLKPLGQLADIRRHLVRDPRAGMQDLVTRCWTSGCHYISAKQARDTARSIVSRT